MVKGLYGLELTVDNLRKNTNDLDLSKDDLNTQPNKLTRVQIIEKRVNARRARAKEYRGLLEKNGWSQAELARQLGMSRAWVTTVLKGP